MMTAAADPVDVARQMRDEATRHKRLSRHHRRQARQTMRRLEEFCREHGIAMETVTPK